MTYGEQIERLRLFIDMIHEEAAIAERAERRARMATEREGAKDWAWYGPDGERE